jgi:hypothetical protein
MSPNGGKQMKYNKQYIFTLVAFFFTTLTCNFSFADIPFKLPNKMDSDDYFELLGKKIYITSFFARKETTIIESQTGGFFLSGSLNPKRYFIYLTDRVNIKECISNNNSEDKLSVLNIISSEYFSKLEGKDLIDNSEGENKAIFTYYDPQFRALWFFVSIEEKSDYLSQSHDLPILSDGFFGFCKLDPGREEFYFIDKNRLGEGKNFPFICEFGKIDEDKIVILTSNDPRATCVNYPVEGSKLYIYDYRENSIKSIEIQKKKKSTINK